MRRQSLRPAFDPAAPKPNAMSAQVGGSGTEEGDGAGRGELKLGLKTTSKSSLKGKLGSITMVGSAMARACAFVPGGAPPTRSSEMKVFAVSTTGAPCRERRQAFLQTVSKHRVRKRIWDRCCMI